jgi:hypothetical protein
MGRIHIILLFIFSFSFMLQAQKDSVYTGAGKPKERPREENRFKDKFTYGGDVQAWFGTTTYVYLAPSVGFLPVEKLNIGVGFIYNYFSGIYLGYGRYSQSLYGPHTYLRYTVSDNFFIHAQYDRLSQVNPYNTADPNKRVWVEYPLAGVGLSQPVGENAYAYITFLYNFNFNKLSVPQIPVIIQSGIISRF